jgi:uncharacterized coiled-coil protein SlyX
MDSLTKRNFNALSEGLKEQRSKNQENFTKIQTLETTVAQLRNDLERLHAQLTALLPRVYGTGATKV